MQITQTVSEDLHRQFTVTVPASELDSRVNKRLEEMKPQINMKGFRPGKAPVSFLKKQFGKSIMGEVVEAAVNEGSQKAISDNSLKPALQPRVEPVGDVQAVVDGKADLTFNVIVDLMPEFETADVATLKVERITADITDADIDEALKRLADNTRSYVARAEGEAAQKDDTVVIDFVGSIDGVEFEGGKGEGFSLVLGSGQFIPGFEDQLTGAKAGDAVDVKVNFPDEYHAADLAGKEAVFAVTVKEVKAPEETRIDDELAKKLGLDDLATLKDRVRDQLKNDYTQASRMHLKRRILDALDNVHDFPLPPAMVDHEFANIWAQVEDELKREGKTAADEGKTEDELKAEYRKIAERRVRLGLVLGKLGEQNSISIAPDEVQRAIMARARQFPGQEQQVFQYYANNAQAQAEIRAPLFEEKVVDFIAELAQVTEKKVDRETLFADPEDEPVRDAEKTA
ncbi:MAG: trigger factor [Alphaproteobacteria bacterium]|nr:trigger factor [Alphaproteobacteria bacterium]